MLADHRSAPIEPKLKAMLDYLEVVTLTPDAVTVEHARALKASGVTKAAATEALWVTFCFNEIARVADALGWEILDTGGFMASAKTLLRFGYLLPFHSKH